MATSRLAEGVWNRLSILWALIVTDYVVAPFWGDIDITERRGYQVSKCTPVSMVLRNWTVWTKSSEMSVEMELPFNGKWMLVAQWTEVAETKWENASPLTVTLLKCFLIIMHTNLQGLTVAISPFFQNNTFEGILITDGNSTSYAVFIYRCRDINWAGDRDLNAVVGYRINRHLFDINPASFSDDVLWLGCNNTRTYPWENLIYQLAGKVTEWLVCAIFTLVLVT